MELQETVDQESTLVTSYPVVGLPDGLAAHRTGDAVVTIHGETDQTVVTKGV